MVKRRMEYENRFLAAVLYLALIETCAFAGQWDFMSVWHEVSEGATGTTADWFDSNNWGIQDNGFGFGPRVPDWTVCAAIQPRPPDCCISMSSPYYYGPDAYGYDAACSNLQVHPWSWAGISVNGMTVTDGKINCGWKIGVCAYNQFPSDTSGYGVLDVNGGQLYTPGLRNFDANDPYDPCKFDDPAAPWIEGQGLSTLASLNSSILQ